MERQSSTRSANSFVRERTSRRTERVRGRSQATYAPLQPRLPSAPPPGSTIREERTSAGQVRVALATHQPPVRSGWRCPNPPRSRTPCRQPHPPSASSSTPTAPSPCQPLSRTASHRVRRCLRREPMSVSGPAPPSHARRRRADRPRDREARRAKRERVDGRTGREPPSQTHLSRGRDSNESTDCRHAETSRARRGVVTRARERSATRAQTVDRREGELD
jgi:hypothetical protein